MKKRMTVREIAAMAGVSAATVSRILNGSDVVSDVKRRKVFQILDSLGSHAPRRRGGPDPGGNIGVLLLPGCEADPRVILNKLRGITELLPRKWNLQLLPADLHPQELESRHLRGGLAGLLLIGHDVEDRDHEQVLAHIPHVWLNSYRTKAGQRSVLMGNEFAGRIAARYLLGQGCGKTVCLSIASLNPGFPARLDGVRFEFFARAKHLKCGMVRLRLPEGAVLENCTEEELESVFNRRIMKQIRAADGIFSPEDRLTAVLHRVLRRDGCSAPEEFPRIVSCNRTNEYLTGLYPRPASIDMGARTGAELGLEELFRRIAGETCRSDDVAVIAAPHLVNGDD